MTSKTRPLLKSREVAHLLDLSPDDVVVLAKRGELKAQKVGRRWKFSWANVMSYRRRQAREAMA